MRWDAPRHLAHTSEKHGITQALVAIGGIGSRLNEREHDWRTKSFIHFGGRPALAWTLLNMRYAGIERVVLACDNRKIATEGREIALAAGYPPGRVHVFEDAGLGVHGIPFQAREFLDERFLFDAGHSMAPITHYQSLAALPIGRIGYSCFSIEGANSSRLRMQLNLPAHGVQSSKDLAVVGLPYALDQAWSANVATLGFRIQMALEADVARGRAQLVWGSYEPEFDVPEDLRRVRRQFVGTQVSTRVALLIARLDRRLARNAETLARLVRPSVHRSMGRRV